jgi:signal peptidase I
MLQFLMPIIVFLSWLALPVGLLCIYDDWFARPGRQLRALAAGAEPAGGAEPAQKRGGHPLSTSVGLPSLQATGEDPQWLSVAYTVLPVLIGAAVLRLLLAERLDFSAVLLGITVVTGLIWWLDHQFLRARRAEAARAVGKDPGAVHEPGTVDYARSFFPVALVVLLLRSFIFEPFRIPSDSMMPTLLDGDFIIVNKFSYGLRLPVINKKFLSIGSPQRGDVVVFRYPRDPSVNYIKRLVGLPGDHIEVRNDRISVNGKPVPFNIVDTYNDGCYINFQRAQEHLGTHVHDVLLCPVPLDYSAAPPPGCNRRNLQRGYLCGASSGAALLGDSGVPADDVVPPGQYLMMGDNRDNSDDGRSWGFVPEDNLVGKATRIWFNWDLQRSGGPMWGRIGTAIK